MPTRILAVYDYRSHLYPSYLAVFSCNTVYYAVQGGFNLYESVDKTLVRDRSNESYLAIITVYYAVQSGLNWSVCE